MRFVFGVENTPSWEIQIALGDVEHLRGDCLRLRDDLLGREMESRSGQSGRARSAGAFAEEHLVGVALDVLHLRRIEPEPVADDLLERRLVSLALAVRTGEHRHRAIAVETDFRTLERSCARALDRIGDAEAA